MCVLNGRLGDNGQFTCISTKGKSVVDYAFIPHEQLHFWTDFNIHLITDIISNNRVLQPERTPDHSLLTWKLLLPNVMQVDENCPNPQKHKWYNLKNIPDSFMNSNDNDLMQHIGQIEQKLNHIDMLDEAYADFKEFVISNMDEHLESKEITINSNTNHKSKYKPYWNTDLQKLWNTAAQKEKLWLSFNGSGQRRSQLKHYYCEARKLFDKRLRRAKRSYQREEEVHLLELNTSNETAFWKKNQKS